MPDDHNRASIAIALCCRDPKAAPLWPETAFGLEPFMVTCDKEGNLMHSGDRTCRARDPKGLIWTLTVTPMRRRDRHKVIGSVTADRLPE
jgi:hypothetical protein